VLNLNNYYLPGWTIGSPNRIGGSIPAEIGSLSKLRLLDLAQSEVSEVPPQLGLLSSLETLNLDVTTLTSLPSTLGGLLSLNFLRLGVFMAPLPAQLGTLPKLATVDLSASISKGLPAGISQLTNIRQLILRGDANGLPEEVFTLTNLTSLVVTGNRSTGVPSGIANLTNLEELRWTNGRIQSIPPHVGELRKLTTLALENNPLTGPIPRELGQLTHLQSLQLREFSGLTGTIPPDRVRKLAVAVLMRVPPGDGSDGSVEGLFLNRMRFMSHESVADTQ